ncbi:MAG TPA: DUF305 domain-containing protein [Pseudonocardiaceae bacterium]|nr:DUF305 domain-containing protein [Pseudonocardiaceae bacterium]
MATRTITVLVAALTTAAALSGCGTTAGPPSGGSPAASSVVAQGHNQADIAFAQDMISHHAQVVTMSSMAAQRAGSTDVKELAQRIQDAHQPEIDQMSGWLRSWNAPVPSADHMGQTGHAPGGAIPGMMSASQMNQLGQLSGAAFDQMFLQMMIEDHQAAVTMSEKELGNGRSPDARQLAQHVIDTQQHEIGDMRTLLAG